jgi:O-succinylbenzoate synthase
MREKRVASLKSIGRGVAERVLRESRNQRDYDLSPTDLYVAGELDKKYVKVMDGVEARTAIVPRAGHAVLEEAPPEVAAILAPWLGGIGGGGAAAPLGGDVIITRLSFKTAPLDPESTENFARGDLAHRTAFTVEVSSAADGVRGIGEAAPLNKLHPETAEDVEIALKALSSSVAGGGFSVPLESLDFSTGAMARVVDEMGARAGLDLEMLPSLRAALESAILMLVGGEDFVGMASAKNGGTMRDAVRYNTLVSQQGSSIQGGGTVKVKIGNLEDVARVDEISGHHEAVRLDANGQMEWDESVDFGRSLSHATKAKIDYVEEPLSFVEGTPLGLRLESLSDWSKLTGLRYALDESLAFGELAKLDEAALEGCGAVVLKPTLIGFERSWRIARRAKELGVDVVVTSCFDGAVGLCHLTWFAALLDGGEGMHGLSTFDRYGEGVMQGFLESVVLLDDRLGVNGAMNYLATYAEKR